MSGKKSPQGCGLFLLCPDGRFFLVLSLLYNKALRTQNQATVSCFFLALDVLTWILSE